MGAERPDCAYPRSAGLGLGGVARRRRGWAGAPGGRCRRRRHSAAMEWPRAAADGLLRWPHGLGLIFLLPLLPPATLGQDRLDAPPPPAAPLSRWAGPVGVSWGLRAAAPGAPYPRGGRWRRSAPDKDEDEDCGRIRDFVARLANNTHQVSGRRARAPPGLRDAAPGLPRLPAPPVRLAFPRSGSRPPAATPGLRPRNCGGPNPARGAAPGSRDSRGWFRHRRGRRSLSRRSFFQVVKISWASFFSVCIDNWGPVTLTYQEGGGIVTAEVLAEVGLRRSKGVFSESVLSGLVAGCSEIPKQLLGYRVCLHK